MVDVSKREIQFVKCGTKLRDYGTFIWNVAKGESTGLLEEGVGCAREGGELCELSGNKYKIKVGFRETIKLSEKRL